MSKELWESWLLLVFVVVFVVVLITVGIYFFPDSNNSKPRVIKKEKVIIYERCR
jgi:hypothetical protein